MISAIREWTHVSRARVVVSLDASRRWVTLSGVHPDFVRAVGDGEDRRRGAGALTEPAVL